MSLDVLNRQKCLLFILAVFYCSYPIYACRTTIHVRNQIDFDRLPKALTNVIASGNNDVRIRFAPGEYTTKDGHFSFRGINNPKLKLNFEGNGAFLLPQGRSYKDGDPYVGTFSVDNCWMYGEEDVYIWSSIKVADGLIEVVDQVKKLCRVKSQEMFPPNSDLNDSYIMIPQSYLSYIYKITKTEGRYVYFVAHNLARMGSGWNVNYEHYYSGEAIRFKLCNIDTGDDCLGIINGKVKLPKLIPCIWEGTIHCFFSIEGCKIKNLLISGFKIIGNRKRSEGAAIYLNKLDCESCIIKGCEFYGIRSDVIKSLASQNVVVKGNIFKDCYLNGVDSDNMSRNTKIIDNRFDSMGKAMMNSFSIKCSGSNFVIRGNVLKNFGYGGIGVGVWYLLEKINKCYGLIENNELFYTEQYIEDKQQKGLMDAGAIYLWTKMDGVSIRNNFIHDIDGMYANRGIFCDDGAYNFEIIGNVIVRVHNSYCIDSRLVRTVEDSRAPGSGIEHSNINITMEDNIVDGYIKFVGNATVVDNHCIWGLNYILSSKGNRQYVNDIHNVKTIGENIVIQQTNNTGGPIEIDASAAKILRNSKEWKKMRQYVRVRK